MMFLSLSPRRWLSLAFMVAVVSACTDEARRPTGPIAEAPDDGLPKLRPGGSALVLMPGGSVPTVTAEWAAGFASAARATRAAAAKTGASFSVLAAPRSPAPHFEHVLLENATSGARALWVVSRGSIVNSAGLGTMPTSWHMTGAGDFNSDGLEDILWENTADGTRAVWLMNGSGGVNAAVSFGVVPLDWHMAGAGDYNSDGKDDILWENLTDGTRVLWIMNGGSVQYTVTMGTLNPVWQMHGANDYNSDGKDDILLDNDETGQRVLWIMNGNGSVEGSVTLGTLPFEWRMVGGGDIDGDYHEDILYEHKTNGTRAAWLENGFAKVTSASVLTVLNPTWQMKAVLTSDLGDRTGTWIGIGEGYGWVSCGLRTGGVAYCWGYNYEGTLGLNHADRISWPTPLPVSTRVRFSEISSGLDISCGIDLDGAAHCWGNISFTSTNSNSVLGNGGAPGMSMAPTPVTMPSGVMFSKISTGRHHTCALSTGGGIYCWGWNGFGQLGTDDGSPRYVPTLVSAAVSFTGVTTGYYQTCGVASGSVYCWGKGDWEDPGSAFSNVPVLVELPAAVTEVSAGHSHACALGVSGVIYCWGGNDYGEIGAPAGTHPSTPTTVLQPRGVTFSHVSAGGRSTCALTTSGDAYCWGDNQHGNYGNGTNVGGYAPAPVSVPAGVQFTKLTVGGESVCALATTSAMYCWGSDTFGKVGRGDAWTNGNVLSPSLVVEPKVIVAQ